MVDAEQPWPAWCHNHLVPELRETGRFVDQELFMPQGLHAHYHGQVCHPLLQ